MKKEIELFWGPLDGFVGESVRSSGFTAGEASEECVEGGGVREVVRHVEVGRLGASRSELEFIPGGGVRLPGG